MGLPDVCVLIRQAAEMLLHFQLDFLQRLLLPQMRLELVLLNAAQLCGVLLPNLLVHKNGGMRLQSQSISVIALMDTQEQPTRQEAEIRNADSEVCRAAACTASMVGSRQRVLVRRAQRAKMAAPNCPTSQAGTCGTACMPHSRLMSGWGSTQTTLD